MDDRRITTRRTVQQIKHCVEEALAIIERNEDARCAVDDLDQAGALIAQVLKTLRAEAKAGSYSASAPVTVSREAWDALQRGARG